MCGVLYLYSCCICIYVTFVCVSMYYKYCICVVCVSPERNRSQFTETSTIHVHNTMLLVWQTELCHCGTSLGERGETVFVQIVLLFLIFCLYLNLLCARKQTSAIVEHHSRELLKATHPPFNFNSSQAPVTKLSSRENSAAPYKQRFSKHQNLHTMFTSMSATLSTSMSKGNLISKKL